MPTFIYKAVNSENKVEEGKINALFRSSARRKLAREGKAVLYLEAESEPLVSKLGGFSLGGFSSYERILFFRNFAMMSDAGLTVVGSLDVLREQVKSTRVKGVIKEAADLVSGGKRLSEALLKYPSHFPPYLAHIIRVGEHTGAYSQTFERIANDLEKEYVLKKKVQSALAYPVVILAALVAVFTLLMIYALPQIAVLFTDLGAPIPWITQQILNTGSFVTSHPWFIVGTLAAAVLFIAISRYFDRSRHALHYILIRIPIFGGIIREYNLVRFLRALDSLVSSGVSLILSLEVAKETFKNDVFRKSIDTVYPVVLHGYPLSQGIREHEFLYPLQLRRVIEVGEKTGKLGESLRRSVAHYDQSLSHKTSMISSLIEPILMLVAGVLVGLLAYSIFLPLYSVSDYF